MMIRPTLLICAMTLSLALAAPAGAQIFGPSDEEKAHEAGQDKQLTNQDARLKDLEDKVRALTDSLSHVTGTNEDLNHQLQVQSDKIDRMQKDFAYRLCTLSAQQMNAGDAMNCAATGTASAGPQTPALQTPNLQTYAPPPQAMHPGDALPPVDGAGNFQTAPAGAARGRPPGTLGTLPADAAAPAQNTHAGQYDAAMNLLAKAQYNEAASAFRAYADANPDDTDLSPQALYWVANISFTRQDYAPAARTYAEVIKKYPKSTRAPDAMLRLAQSFMAMGQKSEGCTTIGLLKSKYPGASAQTIAAAATLRKTACSK